MNSLREMLANIFFEQVNEMKDIFEHEESVKNLIEIPPNPELGDFAFPCFQLAKQMKKSPAQIAQQLSQELTHPQIESLKSVGPYLNIYMRKRSVIEVVLKKILKNGTDYGSQVNKRMIVPIDMSSPNIAKPFSMGHLRSTVIGNALANLLSKCGYHPVRINYLGDWGTQFGKLIAAYQRWGDVKLVEKEPIKELFKLYVTFHQEAEKQPELVVEARQWFKKLEDGDETALRLWEWFRDESLKEFNKIYDLLGVSFDLYQGEAYYNDKMEPVISELKTSGLLVESEGAEVVDLSEWELPPALIRKSDGATLYATRDLAAAIHRYKEYKFASSLYVVGHEQSLHFEQIKKVLSLLNYDWAMNIHHIPFGMILKDGKKMSTRKGKVVLLDEVLTEAIQLAERNIEEKNPQLKNKQKIAEAVGVGAIIFHDLKNFRLNNIEFSLEEMLKFEGETGPYVQYTHARACSILRKGEQFINQNIDNSVTDNVLNEPKVWEIVLLLESFPEIIERACNQFDPSIIAKYIIELSRTFNKYYATVHILTGETNVIANRLSIVKAITIVLKEGLRLLGLKSPQEM